MSNQSYTESNGDITKLEKKKEQLKFSSTCSTYLTLLGYSMGTSDIWRFPFLAYRNGGGAFLIPFMTMILVCGIPLYFLEYSVGKFSSKGPYAIWDISPLFRGVGISVSLAYVTYITGTTIFRCWILEFLIYAVRNPVPWQSCDNDWNTDTCRTVVFENRTTSVSQPSITAPVVSYSNMSTDVAIPNASVLAVNASALKPMSATEEFWQYKVLQLSTGMTDLSPVLWKYMLFVLVVRVIIFLGHIKSIQSIEKVIYVTATVPFILTVIIFINSLTLPGARDGIYYFFYPEFSKLLSAKVWIEATLMSFYTLSFGWGATILLGSHAHFKENSLRTAIIIPLIDSSVAMFSGLVCFSVLGNMAFSYNVHVKDVIDAAVSTLSGSGGPLLGTEYDPLLEPLRDHKRRLIGFESLIWNHLVIAARLSTGIVAYITALTSLPVPQLWNVFFLVSLFMTGIESQLVPMDMATQLIGDLFPRLKQGSRIPVLIVLSLVVAVCSLPTCTGAGGYLFLWVDWYGGAWTGTIVSFIEVIVIISWIYGLDRLNEDTKLMIGRPIPAVLRWTLAFISPLIVAVIFAMSCVQYVPPKYGAYTYPAFARAAGWILVAVLLLPIPIQAVFTVWSSKGTLISRIRRHLRPLESWGPSEETLESMYNTQKTKYDHRRFKDLFYYNVFGRYPADSPMNINKVQELKRLGTTDF